MLQVKVNRLSDPRITGICALFEDQLKRANPHQPSITYEIGQLFEWLESLADISCLVLQRNSNSYAPYSMAWIKEKIYAILRHQAP